MTPISPVSYTHLDVYKRQQQGRVGLIINRGNQVVRELLLIKMTRAVKVYAI